jgi:hypothetical protein
VLTNGRSNKRGHFFKSQVEVTAKPSSDQLLLLQPPHALAVA